MFQTKSAPFEDDVEKATNENNLSEDWSLIMHICDNAINYQDGAKFCLKAIMKRLHHNVPRVVMQALTLLDVCVKNCDRRFLLQVASSDFTTEVRKLLGKMHPSAVIKLKELLQKWSLEEFKDDPELCIIPALYYKLKSEGVEFPPLESEKKPPAPICTDPNAVTSQDEENDIIKALEISLKDTGRYSVPVSEFSSGSDAKQVTESFKARVLFDFEAAEDNELTIKAGEIVLILDNSNDNWWKASNHRGEGLIPTSFVTEDLDFNPLVDKPEEFEEKEHQNEIESSAEHITINEEKIDKIINWLNDVDPTEELSDPEDMLKLEKECYKMAPLIEENLHAIDNRMAKLDLTNEKIMEAFDLFHELSNHQPVLPSNMKMYSNTLQNPYAQYTLPYSVSNTLPNPSNTFTSSATLPSKDSSGEERKKIDIPQQVSDPQTSSQASNSGKSEVAQVSNIPINQMIHPASMMNPYGGNMMGGIFIPPGVPFPFQPNPQQVYPPIPFSGTAQPLMGMPFPVQAVGTNMPYQCYYLNNASTPVNLQTSSAFPINQQTSSVFPLNQQTSSAFPVNMQANASTSVGLQTNVLPAPSDSQAVSSTLNTSTVVSNVLNAAPLSSVSSYSSDLQQMASIDPLNSANQNSKLDSGQNVCSQASGDGQASNSGSSSENS